MNNLFYNRDRNITGLSTLTGLVFGPSYGSSASFTTKANELPYPDMIVRRSASNLNSVVGEYNLIFRERESDAQSIVNYIESLSGVIPAVIQDPSNIYHTISGFIDEFSWAAKTNLEYELTAKVVVDNVSPQLNWSGLSFVSPELENWEAGGQISKYDIRYFEFDGTNKLNNIFYCTGDHVASVSNCPFSTGSLWTQNLFFDNSLDYSIASQPAVNKLEISSSFPQRIKDGKNIHSIRSMTLRFPGVSDKKAKAILHFAESKFGTKRFEYQIPKIYNRPKLFICPSWRHTWDYKNTNTVELDIVEDPLGVLGGGETPAIQLSQNNGKSSFEYYFDSVNDIGIFDFGSGRLLLPDGSGEKTWGENVGHMIRVYGPIEEFSSNNQRINTVSLGSRSPLQSLSLSGNYMTSALLNGVKSLNHVNLSKNSLPILNLDSLTGLKSLMVENNLLTSLDISDCSNLTGLFCSGNQLSYPQVSGILNSLVNQQNYSGVLGIADGTYPDVVTNSVISGSSFVDAATLSWRGWGVNVDNCVLPFNLSGTCSPVAWFQQESITGYENGNGLFSWIDSVNSIEVSRYSVIDSERPTYLENQIGARPILSFDGEAFLNTPSGIPVSEPFGIFCAYKNNNSLVGPLFSDKDDNGLYVSGGYPGYIDNGSFYSSNRAFDNQVNVLGANIVSSGAYIYNNSLTGEFLPFSPSSFSSGYSIGSGLGFLLNGQISEIILATGISSTSDIIQGLGWKHGVHVL